MIIYFNKFINFVTKNPADEAVKYVRALDLKSRPRGGNEDLLWLFFVGVEETVI